MKRALFGLALTALFPCVARADALYYDYTTPPDATAGGFPVGAEAQIWVWNGNISATFINLVDNPANIMQTIGSVTIAVGNGSLDQSYSITSGNGNEVNVQPNGLAKIISDSGGTAIDFFNQGWGYSVDVSGKLATFSDLSYPTHLLIGRPDIQHPIPGIGYFYFAADGSITGSDANPFAYSAIGFTQIIAPGIIVDPSRIPLAAASTLSATVAADDPIITGVSFSFGSASGPTITVGYVPTPSVPEPSTMAMTGIALSCATLWYWLVRRRTMRLASVSGTK